MKQGVLTKKPVIVMDDREPPEVEIFLKRRDILVIKKRLEVGDYIIGDIGIERKSARDFLSSILDGRIFEQIENLKENFENFLLIVEGDFFMGLSEVNVHENLIRGVLLSIALEKNVGIIYSRDLSETCEYLYLLSKKSSRGFYSFGRRTVVRDPKISILSSFPGIGPKLARKLLERFKTLYKIFNASYPELKKVLGEKRAMEFIKLLRGEGG